MGDLVGFRFHPSEVEIISYYLARKLKGLDFPVHAINEVEFNKFEPWELPVLSAIETDDRVWYFFTVPVYMDSKRTRINRRTGAGFWKVTGRDRQVRDKRGRVIGQKKTLVYHKGHYPDGLRTNWAMQEYHYKDAINSYTRPLVLCRLKDKSDGSSDEPNPHLGSNPGNLRNANIVPRENNEIPLALQWIQENNEIPLSLQWFSEEDFNVPSVLQSRVPLEEQGPSCFKGWSLPNEIEASSSRLDTGEQGADFVNSLWADDEDVHLHEETVQTRLHDFKPEEPLSGYAAAGSSDFNPVQAMSVIVAKSHRGPDAIYEQAGEVLETHGLHQGRFKGSYMYAQAQMGRSSPEKIKKIPRITSNSIMDRSTPEKIKKIPQITVKPNPKLQSNGSNESCRKRSFIFLHTPPSSHHEQDPPSVYIANILVGLILFLFFVREMAFLH